MSQEVSWQEIKESLSELKELKGLFIEIGERFKETDARIKEQFAESNQEMEKLRKVVKTTQKTFNSQWGKLIETLVEGDLIRLFNERDIEVWRTSTRIKGIHNGNNYEIDIIAHNGDTIIVVEIKTTLLVEDVDKHLRDLNEIKQRMPEYKNHMVQGAVAYLKADEESNIYAQKKGLWVIRATGNSATIINKDKFKAKLY